MKFSAIVLAASAGLASAASSVTLTRTITNNGMTYTKTATEEYTGQTTTEPASGTYTFTIPKGSRTKLLTNTYGQATTVSTHQVISGPDETYTRPLVQAMHTTEVSSFLSSHSSHLSAASKAAENASDGGSSSSSSGSDSSSSGSDSSSTGAAAALHYGAGVGAVGIAAALIL
ncbi:uncharacterized protein CXQ87_001515 [Candidozyma duobushaemuli]|uniref:Uncharacterized protein n=2 Tax=Candidozyma TaxID=3303203 RepID=A0ABX8I1L2_9ASCO|nr:uncharacterized protein CXQ87_001515 [[Candida] duobushaemulonis]PVH18584.1 hypothetical protein CXQ87_001515 [[Candida] duobushaemulonis]QWU87105.1 hypothetical protein CA3LBN_001323 [[Candida] haemuloni]